MEKNFYAIRGTDNNRIVYRVFASNKVANVIGSDVIAYCYTNKEAEWICGALECYVLLCDIISHNIFSVIDSHMRDDKNK